MPYNGSRTIPKIFSNIYFSGPTAATRFSLSGGGHVALQAGVCGLHQHPSQIDDFTDGEVAALDRIRVPLGTAMAGRELLDRSLAWAGTSAEPPAPRLTPRQREVVALVAQGLTNCQIGVRLGISESAVRAHLGKALRLTGRPDRASVAVWWCQSGHDDAG